jgi:hypothetical protein
MISEPVLLVLGLSPQGACLEAWLVRVPLLPPLPVQGDKIWGPGRGPSSQAFLVAAMSRVVPSLSSVLGQFYSGVGLRLGLPSQGVSEPQFQGALRVG